MGGKSDDPNKAAMAKQEEQMNRLDRIDLPDLEKLALDSPELVGLLQSETIEDSAMEDINVDPRLKGMQMDALQALQERSETGLTEEDKYAMEELLGQSAAQEMSQRAGIEQSMAEQGMDDSGQALLMKMQANQSAGNRGRQQAMQMAQQARQGRETALANMANSAGQMRGQDFAQSSQIASAKDRIAAANAQNRQNVNAQNLSARQQIANQRSQMANQNQMYNKNLPQQQFQNELSKAGAQGGVANSMSSIAGSAQQGPSALQAGASGAATGAAVGGPWGAAIGGGIGVLSTMEDGGIAGQPQKPQPDYAGDATKQHETFKKKYMKRIHNEILGEPERAKKEVTGKIHAEDGAVMSPYIDYNKLAQGAKDLDEGKTPEGAVKMGIDNDMMSEEVMTNTDAKEVLAQDEGMSIDGDKLAAGLKGLSSMMGDGDQPRRPMNINPVTVQAPENVLGQGMDQVQQFANPFKAENGGTYYAEDGSLMFTSDGEGDIVDGDSFERDRVDARLNSGEAVLNVAQQQRLMDLLKGKISMDELGDEAIVEGVPSEYQEDLTEEIDQPQDEKMMALMEMMKKLENM